MLRIPQRSVATTEGFKMFLEGFMSPTSVSSSDPILTTSILSRNSAATTLLFKTAEQILHFIPDLPKHYIISSTDLDRQFLAPSTRPPFPRLRELSLRQSVAEFQDLCRRRPRLIPCQIVARLSFHTFFLPHSDAKFRDEQKISLH